MAQLQPGTAPSRKKEPAPSHDAPQPLPHEWREMLERTRSQQGKSPKALMRKDAHGSQASVVSVPTEELYAHQKQDKIREAQAQRDRLAEALEIAKDKDRSHKRAQGTYRKTQAKKELKEATDNLFALMAEVQKQVSILALDQQSESGDASEEESRRNLFESMQMAEPTTAPTENTMELSHRIATLERLVRENMGMDLKALGATSARDGGGVTKTHVAHTAISKTSTMGGAETETLTLMQEDLAALKDEIQRLRVANTERVEQVPPSTAAASAATQQSATSSTTDGCERESVIWRRMDDLLARDIVVPKKSVLKKQATAKAKDEAFKNARFNQAPVVDSRHEDAENSAAAFNRAVVKTSTVVTAQKPAGKHAPWDPVPGGSLGSNDSRHSFDAPAEIMNKPEAREACEDAKRKSAALGLQYEKAAIAQSLRAHQFNEVVIAGGGQPMVADSALSGPSLSSASKGTSKPEERDHSVITDGPSDFASISQQYIFMRRGVLFSRFKLKFGVFMEHNYFGAVLCIYNVDKTGAVEHNKSKMIALKQCKVRSKGPGHIQVGGKLKYSFCLKTVNKEYWFAVDDKATRDVWIEKITQRRS
ncbi:hypothetical protein FVE85_4920 [Porphyridium purpureum]|uniref:PH domain-containing protein n=1 Tax=Porphyridium purpureum TaxID=35688 RepID=A0A5J4YSJ2_PORPP|nr:hypothetical protein FVE85_4920 [Porphyridium purpureum]|eukprot:POR9611..scf236_6